MPRSTHQQQPTLSAMLTLQQAAEQLVVTPNTVRRFIARGELEAVRIGPRLIRVRRTDLAAFMGEAPAGRATGAKR